jgi:hypothetical protein
LVDSNGLVCGAFAATLRDDKWTAEVAKEATDGIYNHVFLGTYYSTRKQEKERRKNGQATPLDKKIPRHRGHHAKTIGNSMGSGQEEPCPFFRSVLSRIVLTGLLAQEPFQRIAGFTNST